MVFQQTAVNLFRLSPEDILTVRYRADAGHGVEYIQISGLVLLPFLPRQYAAGIITKQAELAAHHRFLSGLPDREILFDLLRRATSDKPPRVTKSGYLPVGVVRDLVDTYPALYPVPQRRNSHYAYGPIIGTAREATTLTSVLEVGAQAGLLIVEPGESLRATDLGWTLLTGDGDTYPDLQARLLRAWIGRPVAQVPTDPGGRRLTFREYLDRQRPTDREIDADTYGRVQAQHRRPRPAPLPVERDIPF